MNSASAQSFHRAMERAITRKAKQAIEGKQTDHSPAALGPAPFITQAVTSIRMTDEEYQVVMLSKMKAYIRNKLAAISNNPSNSKGNQ